MGTGPTAAGGCARRTRTATRLLGRCLGLLGVDLTLEAPRGTQVLQNQNVGFGFRFQGRHSALGQYRDLGGAGDLPPVLCRGQQLPLRVRLKLFTKCRGRRGAGLGARWRGAGPAGAEAPSPGPVCSEAGTAAGGCLVPAHPGAPLPRARPSRGLRGHRRSQPAPRHQGCASQVRPWGSPRTMEPCTARPGAWRVSGCSSRGWRLCPLARTSVPVSAAVSPAQCVEGAVGTLLPAPSRG